MADKPYLDRVEVYAFSADGRLLGGRFKGDGFMVPGGTVDKGETLKAAAERECLEEAGWSIRVVGDARLPSRHEDYKPPYSAKIKERAKKYRGTHTVCLMAVCGDEPEMEYVDDVMTDVGLWTLDDAIAACNDKGAAVKRNLEVWRERFADDESLTREKLEDEGIRANTKEAAEKPADCTCKDWPKFKLRNGSTHHLKCPAHKRWEAAGGWSNFGKKAAEPSPYRKYTFTPKLEAAFTPDFSPEELDAVSLPKLDHFLGPNADVGFRAWYGNYAAGKRTEDDARQIKRWMGVRARWLPLFQREPTANRALALASWGIDPGVHIPAERRRDLTLMLKAFERKQAKKTAAETEDRPFTLCVDLDGTLAEQMKPFDPDVVGPPRADAVRWMEAFRDAGARLVVWTVRGNAALVKEWLDDHNVPYDYINENPDHPPDGSRKVLADLYLDDRGVSAAGAWNDFGAEVLKKILAEDDSEP